MRPLIIGKDTQRLIDAAVAKARANPTPWAVLAPFAMKDRGPSLNLDDRPLGNKDLAEKLINRSQFVEIPVGFLCAFSFEYQPAGLIRHLSISVSGSEHGRMPSVEAAKMIAEAFGFHKLGDRLWVEEFAPNEYAVNIAQLMVDS